MISTSKDLRPYLITTLSAWQAINITSILVDPITSTIYHIEARPSEGGRGVIVDTSKGKDVFGPGWNARSRVEEYGGGAATAYGGVIYFSNFADLRVYKVDVGKKSEPVAITPGIFYFPGFAFCFWSFVQSGVDEFTSRHLAGKTRSWILQRTKSTDSRISPYRLLILTSSLRFWKITLIRPHQRSKPLSSRSTHPLRRSHRWSLEQTFTLRLGFRRMGSIWFGNSGGTRVCLGKARRSMSQR